MNSVSSNRIVIFSKSADPEFVKTRMRPDLAPQECLSLHLALLKDTLGKVRNFPAVLYLTGSGSLPFQPDVPVCRQTGEDLGTRMLNAFIHELKQAQKVIIIGTDSPMIDSGIFAKAFDALDQHEIVLGPCPDGGYYLVGLSKVIPEMFAGIPWGTERVLETTLAKISHKSYLLLDPYRDLDVPADLELLRIELEQRNEIPAEHLRKWIAYYFGSSPK